MKNEEGLKNSQEVTFAEALTYIHAKLEETLRTGRIDTEKSDFKTIEEGLVKREITPDEARRRVNDLIAARQDYN